MEESTVGIPDVAGLGNFVAQNTDAPVQPSENVAPEQGQPPVEDKAIPKDPFGGDYEKLLKSYKEIQGFSTRVSQENKSINERMRSLEEQLETMAPPVPQYQAPAPNFEEMFAQNPQAAIDYMVETKVQQKIATNMIASVLEQEATKNPTEFQERYAKASALKVQYPHLATTPDGVRKLFAMADRMRENEMRTMAQKLAQFMEAERRGANPPAAPQGIGNAYMPDITRTNTPNSNVPSTGANISDAVKRGDPDSVIKNLFSEALNRK